jgi:hypothetical protein
MTAGKEMSMRKSGAVKMGFKVLEVMNRRLESATDAGERMRYHTRYKNYPKPGNGPLCVFKDLENAKVFAEKLRNTYYQVIAIYECEYETTKRRKVWTINDPYGRTMYDMPEGKALATWVWLVKRVKE